MFDAGFWELLVIGVLALVVVGPERLPRLARTVGLWVGRARHAFYSVRDEIEREADAEGLRETQQAIRRSVEQTESELRSEMESVNKEGRETVRAAQQAGETPAPGGDSDAGTEATTDTAPTDNEEDGGKPARKKDPPDTQHG